MRKHRGKNVDRNFGRRKIAREIVVVGEPPEGLVTDSPAEFGIPRSSTANQDRLFLRD
jgi:hypothetical protein